MVSLSDYSLLTVTKDFELSVRMRSKAFSRSNSVFVDNPKTAESVVLAILIHGKRKRMESLEPPMIGIATVLRVSRDDFESRLGTSG